MPRKPLMFLLITAYFLCFASTENNVVSPVNEVTLGSNLRVESLATHFTENGTLNQNSGVCSEASKCENGGTCLQHVCKCPPGTSGPFCKTVDDCDSGKLCNVSEHTFCKYIQDKQMAECKCNPEGYKYDDATRTCKECKCNFPNQEGAWSNCEYHQGKKVCTCTENHSYDSKNKKCEQCECGEKAKWCEFNDFTQKICICESGYQDRNGNCEKCDCGKHGLCTFSESIERQVNCLCDPGYGQYNETCYECSCGKYGKCIFDTKGKQVKCKCESGYSEKSGKCEVCFCGDNSNCTFIEDRKVCECFVGYKDVNGFCVDIDECSRNPCEDSKKCVNVLGSYECLCADGYITKSIPKDAKSKITVCKDIDECEKLTACPGPNTECVNTLGSFQCICEAGFVYLGGTASSTVCGKSPRSAIYTVAITTPVVVILLTVGMIYYLRRIGSNLPLSGPEYETLSFSSLDE